MVELGRHNGLKIRRWRHRTGSIPVSGTIGRNPILLIVVDTQTTLFTKETNKMANNVDSINYPNTLVDKLTETAAPMAPVGALFRENTQTLANSVVDWLNNNCKIVEADHVIMYPKYDKQNNIFDFDMYCYFNTKNSANSKTQMISKIYGGKVTRNNVGRANLADLVGQNTITGGFNMTTQFKTIVGSIADLNNDGNLIINADRQYPFIAIIKLDFFKVIGLLLAITDDDNFNFSIYDCKPVTNGDNMDYSLLIAKYIDINNSSRRGKNGKINYTNSDRRMINNFSRSNGNYNK